MAGLRRRGESDGIVDDGGGGGNLSDAGYDVEILRQGEEAEFAEVAGFASEGDKVSESKADDDKTEEEYSYKNVTEKAGFTWGWLHH